MGDNPRVIPQSDVNATGLYVTEGIDGALVLGKTAMEATQTEGISIPVPDIYLRGGTVRDNLDDSQRRTYGLVLLGVNGADLLLNDLLLDSIRIPDPANSNTDNIDPNDELREQLMGAGLVLPRRISVSTIKLFSDEVDGILDPARDTVGVMRMIRNNPEDPVLQGLNAGYFGAQLLILTPEINRSLLTIDPINIDSSDYRVKLFIDQTGGYPDGVDQQQYEQQVAQLIETYQAGGDALANLDTIVYFREVLGIDLSNEEDPGTALVLGAASTAAKVAPESALIAMLETFEIFQANQRYRLGVASAAGLQHTIRELSNLPEGQEDLLAGGIALGTGLAQIGMTAALNDGEVEPLVVLIVGAQQGLGFGSAKLADGDALFLSSMILASQNFGGAVARPRAVSGLTFATDQEYIPQYDEETGEIIFAPSPTTTMLTMGVIGTGTANNVIAGKSAGHYIRIAQTEQDARYLTPAITLGAAHLLEIGMTVHYGTRRNLPKTFENEYGAIVEEYNIDDDGFQSNGDLAGGTLAASAILPILGTGAGLTWGYFRQKHVEKKQRLAALVSQPTEVLVAQAHFDRLVDEGADEETLRRAADRITLAQQEATQEAEQIAQSELDRQSALQYAYAARTDLEAKREFVLSQDLEPELLAEATTLIEARFEEIQSEIEELEYLDLNLAERALDDAIAAYSTLEFEARTDESITDEAMALAFQDIETARSRVYDAQLEQERKDTTPRYERIEATRDYYALLDSGADQETLAFAAERIDLAQAIEDESRSQETAFRPLENVSITSGPAMTGLGAGLGIQARFGRRNR